MNPRNEDAQASPMERNIRGTKMQIQNLRIISHEAYNGNGMPGLLGFYS